MKKQENITLWVCCYLDELTATFQPLKSKKNCARSSPAPVERKKMKLVSLPGQKVGSQQELRKDRECMQANTG